MVESLRLDILRLFLAFARGTSFVECEVSDNGKINSSRFAVARRSVGHDEKKQIDVTEWVQTRMMIVDR